MQGISKVIFWYLTLDQKLASCLKPVSHGQMVGQVEFWPVCSLCYNKLKPRNIYTVWSLGITLKLHINITLDGTASDKV